MPLWLCEWDSCRQPAVQRAGDCLLCDRHLCGTHTKKPWHKCPSPEDDWDSYCALYSATETRHLDELCRQIDGARLCHLASTLRDGISCQVDITRKSLSTMMGNQNCHVDVTFQDGVTWLARFRLTKTSSPPREVRDYVLRSEAATMMYLQQHTQVPTPKIFDWACESDPANTLGAGYILMEKLEGEPLDWGSATPGQREKVMQQLVDVFLDIEKHPFDLMGSLLHIDETDELRIQALADPAVFRVGSGGPLGPFSSWSEGMRAILESHLDMIARGEIQASRSVDAYLAHLFRLDVVNSGFPSTEQFFLKHPDDKGDHILVNGTFDIVGIIDWEWTQSVPKQHAFCAPCMMWPVGKFYDGLNDLTTDEVRLADIFRERGRDDLSKYVIEGRKMQRLLFDLGPEGSFSSQESFIRLFTGLRRAFNPSDEAWEQWKENALTRWGSDNSLRRLLELEEG